MSIKTSKRIALGVIASLVFAPFAAIAPASAAAFPSVTVTATSNTLYTVAGTPVSTTFLVNAATNTANGDSAMSLTLANVLKPAQASAQTVNTTTSTANSFTFTTGGTLGAPYVTTPATKKVTVAVTASGAGYTLTPNAGAPDTDATDPTVVGAKIVGTASFTPGSAGKFTYTITPALGTATTITVFAAPAPVSLTATSAVQAALGQTIMRADLDSATINASRPTGGTSADGALIYRVMESPDPQLLAGTIITTDGTPVGADITAALSTNGALVLSNNLVNTVGTYTIKAFVDANANSLFDSTEANADVTFWMAGTPYKTAVSMDRSEVLVGGSGVYGYATVSITDEDAQPTYVYDETFTNDVVTGSPAAVTTDANWSTAVSASRRIGTTNSYTGIVQLYTGSAASPAATYTFRSAISGGTTRGSASIIVRDSATATADELAMTSVVGLYSGTKGTSTWTTTIPADTPVNATGWASGASRVSVVSDVALTTHTYTLTGDESKAYAVTLTVGSGTSSTKFTAPTIVRTLADGKVTFTVVNSAPADTDSYTIDIVDTTLSGALYAGYSVSYEEVEGLWSLTPTSATNARVLKGTTNAVTGTLTDQFGRVLADYPYSISVSGRNVSAASGKTGAAGQATFSVTDTATTSYTTYPSDTVTFTSVGTTDIASGTAAVTFTYVETLAAVASVTVTSPAGPFTIDQREATKDVSAQRQTFTATVRLASGAVAGAGILVTFSADADTLFHLGVNTGVTNSDGQATVSAFKRKAGVISMSATANGVTGTAANAVVFRNTPGASGVSVDARNLVLSTAQTIQPASVATVIATVTDRWGNPVSGVEVTFGLSGAGRLVTGGDLSPETNTAGQAQIQVTSAEKETGAMTVSASIATGNTQALDIAGRVAGALAGDSTVKAGNRTASSTVTFANPVVEVVVPPVAPTLKGSLNGRVLLFGSCMADEGDMIIYVKRPGGAWNEKAKTLECVAGEFDGSLRAPKNYPKYYRVKQEGTGLWSSSVLIRP